ncbi:hypothetical protein V495_00186 [Pseudogymnoascus sp. VKM F-4514 (FW-929)]|nr:hypothetical protein V495_00186 [Pseudogymnoascus sp. VKM F-4514 (FW-929)]KFY67304.1 hypothetical protein V497_00417 [Pseudogymnoascus sp. VKM F-4516 (FW-969)]
MPTINNNHLAKMPILDERRTIVKLEAASEYLKMLIPASPISPLVVPDVSKVRKLIDKNNQICLLLVEYGRDYEILRNSLRDLGTQDVLLNHDEQAYLSNSSTHTKCIAIGDDVARQGVYWRCINVLRMDECRLLGKTWIRLLEPNKFSEYPYNGAMKAEPPWWPSTGPNKITYRAQSRLNKHELTTLLVHIMGVVINKGNHGQGGFFSLDVAKLEETTRKAIASWIADKNSFKDSNQYGFLIPLFRVLRMEERYRRGEFGASATICVDLIDPREIIDTGSGELSENQSHLLDKLPQKSEENLEGANTKQANLSTYAQSQLLIQEAESLGCSFEKRKLAQLLVREAKSCEYKDDETGILPWRISKWSDMVNVCGNKYCRLAVLIPESAINGHESELYDESETSLDDFDYWGEGLYSKERQWYEIGKDEVRSLTVPGEDEVWDGDDGQRYRKSIGLRGSIVGLTREVVIIDNVRYIEHLVLR